MKILLLAQTYFPSVGGGIRFKKSLVDHFRSEGHTVDVLTINTTSERVEEAGERGNVLRLPNRLKLDGGLLAPAYPLEFRRVAKDYDVLHFNFPSPISDICLAAWGRRFPEAVKVVSYHADVVPEKRLAGVYNWLITRRALSAADRIVVGSPNIIESSPHLQPVRDKIRVIPYGIDTSNFTPPIDSSPSMGTEILFVGRLSRYKGVDVLLRAMLELEGSHLSIVGQGPLETQLRGLACELGVDERVTFVGYVPDHELIQYYRAADVHVLPSTDEGEAFGYVLVEAMACGTACISTELGTGTSFVNLNGETGLVVPPNDVAALARALARLASDAGELKRFKQNAIARATALFSEERMLADLKDLYEEARQEKRAPAAARG